MAQTNYTPIQLYNSTTAAAAPIAANLANGELAINITDGKLYYKDNSGVVQVIATKGAGTIGGSTTQIQYNNAGALAGNAAMVFNNSTNVTTLTTLNLTNALGATYGGTAQSTYTQGDVLYSSAANTLAKLGIGAVNYILASTGSVPQWVAPSSIAVLTATNLAGGLAGSVPYQSALDTTTFLAIGAANRVMTSTGSAPQWVTALTGLTGVSSTSLTASTTLGVTGVSTLTGGAVVQGLTVGLGAGAVADNTAVGVSALRINSSGSGNTVVGYQAGYTNTTGSQLTAIGYQAGYFSNGSNNTFVGYYAGILTSSGANNVALGASALLSNLTTSFNVAVGTSALQSNTADNNTAVGYQAGYTNVTGASNVYVGTQAGKDATSNSNVFVGKDAGLTVSSGGGNTYVGSGSGPNVTAGTGTFNTMVGYLSGNKLTTGGSNTSLGGEALFSNTTASNNTAVGYQAGYTNSTGAGNVFLGYQAGYTSNSATSNGYNVAIGAAAGYALTTGIQNTFVGVPAVANGAGGVITAGSFNTIIGGYNGNTDSLDIRTADAYVVLSDGNGARQITMKEGQTLALDSAVPNSGTGITFPASDSPSTNANTLDDYEEGTFTAGIAFGGAAVGVTYDSTPTCTYTKIGRQVTVTGRVGLSSKGSSTGDATITGLIFTPANTGNAGYGSCSIIMNSVTFANQYAANITPNSTSIVLQENSLLGTFSAITDADFSNSSNLLFTATYFV